MTKYVEFYSLGFQYFEIHLKRRRGAQCTHHIYGLVAILAVGLRTDKICTKILYHQKDNPQGGTWI